MIDAPCKDCEERHDVCHDHCEKYQEYKKERELIRKARAESVATGAQIFDASDRMKKRRSKIKHYGRN